MQMTLVATGARARTWWGTSPATVLQELQVNPARSLACGLGTPIKMHFKYPYRCHVLNFVVTLW